MIEKGNGKTMARAMIKVDMERLKNAILRRDISISEASRRCGLNEGYFSAMAKRGEISVSSAITLENVVGVERKEYEKAERKPQKVKQEAPKAEQEAEKSGGMEAISKAAYDGTMKALKEFFG